MTSYFIDQYDSTVPPHTSPNYIVRSELGRGKLAIQSPCISAKMLLTGAEVYTSDDRRFAIQAHQFLLAEANAPLTLAIDSTAKGCCFYFNIQQVSQLIAELISEDLDGGDQQLPSMETIRLPLHGSEFGLAMQAVAHKQQPHNWDSLLPILAESLVHWSHLGTSLPVQRKKTRQELLARLEMARSFIIENRHHAISLADVEAAACLSRYHLSRSFTQIYRVPPLRFHQNLRLDQAHQQRLSGVDAKTLAKQLGFSTVSAFTRAYQRRCAALSQPAIK